MNPRTKTTSSPPAQQAIRDKCFHPSGTFVEFPIEDVETSIPARFEKIVRMYPDHIAIKGNEGQITYRDLNAVADRIARKIEATASDPSRPIALLFENSTEQVAAMLGVLKAGRFFVQLSPAQPQSWLERVNESCQPGVVIAESRYRVLAKKLAHDGQLIWDLESIGTTEMDAAAQAPIPAKADAFILFSSGSTGRPKGILWQHATLLHHVMLRANLDGLCPMDRVTLLTLGTANSVTDCFCALLNGSTLLPYDAATSNAADLLTWLRREQVTVGTIAAPLFRRLAEVVTEDYALPDLRLIRLRSDRVLDSDVALYRRHFSNGCLLENGLATSETGALAVYFIDPETILESNDVPVGYPVDDVQIQLLGDDGKPVGFNKVGEIVVRSRYFSSGYWEEPGLTAAKFKPDPDDPEQRLYYTGDLGLMGPDGCLIHKGRKDFRIKVRGFAVDLIEVEETLSSHPDLVAAVALGHEDESGETRLVGYYTTRCDPGPSASELRNHMKARLADHSIPSAFVKLNGIPLTANGKVDRRALPAPDSARPELSVPYTAPSGAAERELTQIWRGVLGLERIGVNDDFFELGGDSLSAMRAIARTRDQFQVEIPLKAFFEAPTVSALAERLQGCARVTSTSQSQSLEPCERTLPLSFGQERLWFLEQLEPQARRHNLVVAFNLRGSLDAAVLERAINQIAARHESLRTVFRAIDGKPYQLVFDAMKVTVSKVDIGSQAKAEAEAALRQICADEARRPFDLETGPLLRPTVVSAASETIALVIGVHHLIFDGWSMGVFARELSGYYAAALAGQPRQLPHLPVQYPGFAIGQRQRLQGAALDRHLAFWRQQLADIPVLHLPTDRPRPQWRDASASRRWFAISSSVTQSLKDTARQAGATLFMTLLAAYQTLLYRYSGQEDIGVGLTLAGRENPALDETIGFFLNLVVLRVDLAGNPRFLELLGRVREQCLAAYDHQEVPFERLVEALQPKRLINQHPLFQASFTLSPRAESALRLDGLTVEEREVDLGVSRFDLELYIEERERGLHGFIAGAADMFDAATVERMVGHYQNLLEALAANPRQRIAEIEILNAAEKHQLLVEWNDTQREYSKDKCLHQWFEEQAARTPDAVAVVFADQQLTYRELNGRANQLARYFIKRRIAPNSLVAICLERSLEMIVAILATLKAGAVYVPLDPSYPEERLKFMLEDAQAAALVTQESLPAAFDLTIISRTVSASQTICLGRDWSEIDMESKDNRTCLGSADDLAYVIYTSGSTGQPKGVSVTHHNVVRLFQTCEEKFDFDCADVWTLFHSYAFDFSVWEIWGALLYGGRLIVIPHTVCRAPDEFARLVRAQGVTVLNQTPPAFRQLMPHLLADLHGERPALRYVIFGGEALEFQSLRPWVESYGDQSPRLINMYGITETTVHVTHRAIEQSDIDGVGSVIGKPLGDLRVYILDAHRQPVPIGVPGEIYVGGAGVARGYLRHEELTAQRFIDNPFSGEPGAKLYRSGDLARWLANGELEYLGRIDDQVKIRGYRIELGEIEAMLAQHPAVRECAVVAREEFESDNPKSKIGNPKSLVAYVIPHAAAADGSDLRQYLKAKLPDYMVPSAFVFLDSLPMSPNGKVDRRALPDPGCDHREHAGAYVAPRTAVEESIAAIWSEILGRKQIGINDNFFDIGGHSLKATQVVSRLRVKFGSEIPLRHMFEYPTIAELAAAISVREDKQPANVEDLDLLLNEIEAMSEEEAQTLLAEKHHS